MPSWKKVIVSGSDASVRTLFAANSVTSSIFSGSQYIGTSFTGSVFSGSRYIGASFTGSLSGSITPPGSNTTVMYNNNGVLAGSTNFIFDGTNVGIGATSPLARLHAGPNLSDTSNYSFTNTGAVIASFGVDHTAARTNVLSLMRDGTSGVVYAGLAAFDISRWSADSVNARTQLDIRLANTDTNTLTDVISLRSNGNVGIGTTNPSVGKLQINTEAASNNALTIQATSQTSITYGIGIDASSNFAIYDNFSTAQRITINGSGNVGIGTTNPTAKLEINTNVNAASTPSSTLTLNNISDGGHRILFKNGAGNLAAIDGDILSSGAGTDDGVLKFWTSVNGTLSQRMTIMNDGSVGIGETSPVATLQVGTSISNTGTQKARIAAAYSSNAIVDALHIDHAGAGVWTDGVAISLGYKDSTYGSYTSRIVNYLNTATTQATKLQLQTQAVGGTTWNTGILIDDTGDVGIGTTSPRDTLDIFGSAILRSTYNLSWGNTYGAGVPTITGLSGSSAVLAFYPAGSTSGEKVRIDTNGNVGIGTTSPTQKLELQGNGVKLRLSTQTSPSEYYLDIESNYDAGNTINFYGANGTNFLKWIYNTQNLILNPTSGNVGIGNTSPSTRLHTAGSTQSTAANGVPALGFANSSSVALFTNADPAYGTLFGSLSSGIGWIQQQRVDGTATAYNLSLQPNGGNVGIGTTNPGNRLHVIQDGSTAGISVSGGTNPQLRATDGTVTAKLQIIPGSLEGYVGTETNHPFAILTNNTARISVTSVGNVGIGTTTPGANLQIGYQNSSTSEMLRLGVIYTGSPTQRGVISWHDSADVTGQIDTRFDGTKVNMHFGSLYNNAYNSTVRMTILGDGNVGIGTTTPSTALQVNGTVSASAFQLGPVQYAARRYSSTVSNITTGSYTTLFNVYGDALSSAIKVVVRGTANSVVIDSIIDITANHLDDIVIKSQSGIYTLLTIKVLAAGSNTEDFTVQAKIGNHEPAQPLTAYVDVYPYGNEVIEFNPGFAYSSAVLEHDCLPGFNHNSTGGTAYFNINNKARIESTENSDTTPTLYLEGNKGGSSPYTATLIELKSNIDYRGRGITMSTGDTNARWFAGVPYAGASYQIGYDSSGALPYDQGNSALLIDSSKNVLIGATSAGGKLDIAGTTGTTVYARTNGADWNTGIRVQTNNANGGYFHMSFVSGSQYASLQAGDNSAYRSISLNHVGGNVGIGTIAPVSKLQVDGNIGSDYTISDISNYYRNIKPRGGVYNTQTTTITGAIKITYPVGYTNTMHHIKVRVYEYSTNRSFTINFGGYNYAPTPSWYNCFAYIEGDAATDINHAVRFGYDGSKMVVYIGELASSWTYPQVFIDEVAVGYGGYSSAWSTDAWSVGFEASAFANVTATVSDTKAHVFARNGTYAYYNLGDVAIGSTTPSYKLDVLGTIRATGDVIAYSDARVKNNVQPINNALQKVLSLRGVSYTRKDTDDKSTKIGVIAQEVLPVLPEVVSKDDNGNYSVSYGNMVGLLIEAIKEQQKEIDELKYLLKDKKNKK